jgi:hypothetical protein
MYTNEHYCCRYAEVLENTQYALIATVQKLYTMVRNNESWELGDPEMNDRGQPVIHDIASKLGCIRPSPDLPYAFPEGAEDFAELQAQLEAARSDIHSDSGSTKASEDSTYAPPLEHTERASSSESDHSTLSADYNQMLWAQQQQQQQQQQQRQAAVKTNPLAINANLSHPTPLNLAQRASFDDDSTYSTRASLDTNRSVPSPIFTDFKIESPMFRDASSPFSPWPAGDDFLGQPHALDITAQYMRQQQQFQVFPPKSSSTIEASIGGRAIGLGPDIIKVMQFSADGLNFADGTIRPNMLDCSITGSDLSDQMDSIMFSGEYECQMGTA